MAMVESNTEFEEEEEGGGEEERGKRTVWEGKILI